MLRRGLTGREPPCLPATANKFPRRSCATLGARGGDKPDGFDPSACQTYRDIDQFLAEPDEEQFFDAIEAYVVTCVVSCVGVGVGVWVVSGGPGLGPL